MRFLVTMKLGNLISVPVLVLAAFGSVLCQSRKPPAPRSDTVRAKGFRVEGGLANSIEGEVECVCAGVATRIKTQHAFGNGDTVRVGDQGRLEILLEPGYYLRLAGNSEARLLDLSPVNSKIKLLRGSAIVEIEIGELPNFMEGTRDRLFDQVTVRTPRDEYVVTRAGAYRFNVNADSGSDLKVLKGLAIVAGSRVADGTIATLRNGRVELGPADTRAADIFDNWSHDRAVSLIEANKSLKKQQWYKEIQNGRTYFDILDPEESAQAGAAHTISARNGFVRFVEDGAFFRSAESAWETLKAGGSLSSGDRVRTAIESRAEIHPFPDFSLFIGSDTEIIYSEQKDVGVSVAVLRGSVVIICEPDAKVREHNTLTLIAEKMEYEISDKGTYRLNVLPEGKSAMLVYEGVVGLAGRQIRATKGAGRVRIGETELPLNRLEQDSFDIWCSRRSQVDGNRGIKRSYSLGGLWFLNEATNQYTFVPKSWDYRSPYGGKYSIKYTVQSFFRQPRFPSDDRLPPRQLPPRPSN